MSFILGWISSRDEKIFILHERVHPGMPGRKSSRPSWIHLARAYITLYFIPERLFTWGFTSRFIDSRDEMVLRTGMKSSRDEVISGRNHVSSCRQQQQNDQTPRWIPGRKLSCKEALKPKTTKWNDRNRWNSGNGQNDQNKTKSLFKTSITFAIIES